MARQIEPPHSLYAALDRMHAMLRFLRLGDGSLAHFNGMGPTLLDQVSTVLAYDDTGRMFQGADRAAIRLCKACGGRGRGHRGRGRAAADSSERRAHAGCSAFEMSVGHEPLITNCGAPQDETGDWYVVSRSTAAHSTLAIEDLSSARLIKAQEQIAGRELFWLAGPKHVQHEAADHEAAHSVRIGHDGYRERFGFLHRRRLTLRKSGLEFEGHDQLSPAGDGAGDVAGARFAIRFHLHPRVVGASFAQHECGDADDARRADLALRRGRRRSRRRGEHLFRGPDLSAAAPCRSC